MKGILNKIAQAVLGNKQKPTIIRGNISIDAIYPKSELDGRHPYIEWMKYITQNLRIPTPDIITLKGKKYDINGFSDEKFRSVLNKKADFFIENKSETMHSGFAVNESADVCLLGLKISADVFMEFTNEEFIAFFLNLSNTLPCIHLRCHETVQLHQLLHDDYIPRRTFLSPGLVWLNFFGKDEETLQGGEALENNSFATRIERFKDGLFIQVNEHLSDCFTPEGKQRLIDATKAMPPVTYQEPIELEIVDIEDEDEDMDGEEDEDT